MRRAAWMAAALGLVLAAGCDRGPRDDWREALRRPVGDPVAVRPARPLEVPPTLALVPPGGPNRAGGAVVTRAP